VCISWTNKEFDTPVNFPTVPLSFGRRLNNSLLSLTWKFLIFTRKFICIISCVYVPSKFVWRAKVGIRATSLMSLAKDHQLVDSSWSVMAHGDTREGKWRGNWRMEWVACTLHTTSQHGVSSIITADAHISAAGSRLNWRPRRFKWTRPFRRKTKSVFCACAITFQLAYTTGQNLEAHHMVTTHLQTPCS